MADSRDIVRTWRVRTIIVLAALATLVSGAPARGDEILIDGRTLHRVEITAYRDGQLEYRTTSGEYGHVPLRDVRSLTLDSVTGVADFNQAEEFLLKGQPIQAVDRYERALRAARDFWEQVVDVRLLMAADRGQSFEKAVRSFLRIVEQDPVTAAHLVPHLTPATDRRARERTFKRIEEALAADDLSAETRIVVQLLQYDALRAAADASTADAADRIAPLDIPANLLTPRTLEIKTAALNSFLAAKRYTETVQAANNLLASAPEQFLPDILLIKARALLAAAQTDEDYLRAALPAMRVVIHFPDAPQAGEGLLIAAEAHAAAKRPVDAARLLRICSGKENVPANIRKQAQEKLDELVRARTPDAS